MNDYPGTRTSDPGTCNATMVNAARAARGPRWMVSWRIRARESGWMYCANEAEATEYAETLRGRGYGAARIDAPVVAADVEAQLRDAGRIWADAKAAERAAAQVTHAAIVAACDAGVAEAEAARLAGVDRMTVRKARGKRR